MREITNLEDGALGPYRSLKGSRVWTGDELSLQPHDDIFVVESEKVVRALLQSPWEVVSFLALPRYYTVFNDLIITKNIPETAQYVIGRELLDKLAGFHMHQGVLAAVKRPPNSSVDGMQGPFVAMNGLTNPENVGAVVRNAAAFGLKGVIVDGRTVHPFLRRPVRVSMGTAFNMSVHVSSRLVVALQRLKKNGVTVVGAHVTGPVVALPDYRFPQNFCLVIGAEGEGLDPDVVAACDVLVKIPINEDVDSLNVAAATAVMLYHAHSICGGG